MTTITGHAPKPTRRLGFIVAGAIAFVAVAATTPVLLGEYGPWGDGGSSASTSIAGPIFGSGRADPQVTELQQRLKDHPEDFESHLLLAGAYLQKVRETGDPAYYRKADALLQDAAKLDPANPELFAEQGILALARHDFATALEFGKRALALDPERARYYGVVADAQIELGQYDQAIASLQEMVNRRPDFASFTRVAYARELFGDPEGATEAMQFAIESGSTVPENVAWAQAQLGNLYFNLNHYDEALAAYDASLAAFPDFALALSGKAQVSAARGDLEGAEVLYDRAFDAMPLADYAAKGGDVAAARGDSAGAARRYALVEVIDRLYTENGTNTDLELALFFADHGLKPDESLAKARAAYAARPSIHAADVLAWTLYREGRATDAAPYVAEALKLGSRDPLLLFHAAIIERANGDDASAREHLELAMTLNPHFSVLYDGEAAQTLDQLRAATSP